MRKRPAATRLFRQKTYSESKNQLRSRCRCKITHLRRGSLGGIADVFDLRENPDLRKFDNVIIGSSIRSGKVKPEIKQYLEANASWLKDKIRALYIVCGNGQKPITPEIEKKYVTDQLQAYSGAKDVPSHVFLGRITASLLDPPLREAILSRGGEYDNLKRSESLAFGQEILKHA
jgi:menaquinone-dependent protoporphyrinogen IX oxidase